MSFTLFIIFSEFIGHHFDAKNMISTIVSITRLQDNYTIKAIITRLKKNFNDLFENTKKLQSQDEYNKKYEALVKRFETAKIKYYSLQIEKTHRISLSQKLENFITTLSEKEIFIDHFDDTTFRFMVEKIKVSKDKSMTLKFRNGTEIEV